MTDSTPDPEDSTLTLDLKLHYGEGAENIVYLFDEELKRSFEHDAGSEQVRRSVLYQLLPPPEADHRRLLSSDVPRRLASG